MQGSEREHVPTERPHRMCGSGYQKAAKLSRKEMQKGNAKIIRGRGCAGSVDFETEGAIVAAGREGVLAVFERLVSFDLIEMTA